MSLLLKSGVALTSVLSLLVLVGCGATDEDGEQTLRDLWGQSFVSTAVTEDGEPRPLVHGTRIRVTFEERKDQGIVRWQADCNTFGADVQITADVLRVGEIEGTAMGCRDDLHEQDEWLTGFIGADPRWRLSDARLTLTSGETVIELKRAS
jgi:heat shock protein HslJ